MNMNEWNEAKEAIQSRWEVLDEGEIVQADGINELASLISRKSGEPRPNVQHELVHLFQTHAKDHPALEQHFSGTSAARHNDIGPEDDQPENNPSQVQ